jgi:hypothetical protein
MKPSLRTLHALEVSGTGHATFIGTYTGRYRECFDPATGALTNGTFTLPAANGDKLYGTYAGRPSPRARASCTTIPA